MKTTPTGDVRTANRFWYATYFRIARSVGEQE